MRIAMTAAALLGLSALAGCGGGGRPLPADGRLTVNLTWPDPGRLIPAAANSIKIEVFDGSRRAAFVILNRPATQATFERLPVANLLLKATAFPEDPGDPVRQGVVALASGTMLVSVQPGDNPAVGLTMSSTIDRIDLNNATLVVNGGSQTLTATARDAAGDVVLLTPSALQWSSGSDTIATVTQSGEVTGHAAGIAQITVRDTESGKTGSATVTVSTEGGTVNATVNNPPSGTRSVKIEIVSSGVILASRSLAWTAGNSIADSFTGVPAGAHTVTATAYSQASGAGAVLGSAAAPVTVPSLGTGSVTLNLISLVASLELTPANPSVLQGQTVTLAVVARDAATNIIGTLSSAAFNWSTVPTPSGIATVDGAGVVTTLLPGPIVIRAVENRTGQSAQTTVTVTPNTASASGVVR